MRQPQIYLLVAFSLAVSIPCAIWRLYLWMKALEENNPEPKRIETTYEEVKTAPIRLQMVAVNRAMRTNGAKTTAFGAGFVLVALGIPLFVKGLPVAVLVMLLAFFLAGGAILRKGLQQWRAPDRTFLLSNGVVTSVSERVRSSGDTSSNQYFFSLICRVNERDTEVLLKSSSRASVFALDHVIVIFEPSGAADPIAIAKCVGRQRDRYQFVIGEPINELDRRLFAPSQVPKKISGSVVR